MKNSGRAGIQCRDRASGTGQRIVAVHPAGACRQKSVVHRRRGPLPGKKRTKRINRKQEKQKAPPASRCCPERGQHAKQAGPVFVLPDGKTSKSKSAFYQNAHSPPWKISTVSPFLRRPVTWVSSAPTITSSWMAESFSPFSISCARVISRPPTMLVG